nr:MAG: hypothetical protein J07AB56_04930 [Candidatus Nanosalinarum sp. J07AB56]
MTEIIHISLWKVNQQKICLSSYKKRKLFLQDSKLLVPVMQMRLLKNWI